MKTDEGDVQSQPIISKEFDNKLKFDLAKSSIKRNGLVWAYAANTHQGLVRNYNEDRVSIILNIVKPSTWTEEDWPKCSFFGI